LVTRVSVGLPVYNGERYLHEALDSVLAQTHTDLEIVISDNGSDDKTQEICEKYAATDSRIRYVRQPANRGAAFNHNFVMKAATAPYFRMYSYDDRLDPQCIELCAAALDADSGRAVAWSQTIVIDDDGNETSAYRNDIEWDPRSAASRLRSLLGRPVEESLLHMCYPIYGVTRRDALMDTHLLGSNPHADTVLLVELALRGSWVQVPKPLFYNRRHADSSAWNKSAEQIAVWFDPSWSADAFPMPQARLLQGYLRAVLTVRLPLRERAQCLAILLGWFVHERRWRVIGGEFKIRLRQVLARRSAKRG
jgi:glycosyltransferase involved in cell wall biosynthesis